MPQDECRDRAVQSDAVRGVHIREPPLACLRSRGVQPSHGRLALVVQHAEAALVDWPYLTLAVYCEQTADSKVSYVLDEYMNYLNRPIRAIIPSLPALCLNLGF